MVKMRLLAVILSILVAACSTADRWTKTDAEDARTAKDTEECQALGKQHALRRYPDMGGAGLYGPSGVVMSQQQDDSYRASVQASAFGECMQKKGYTRV
jgi:hypothetical protein